MKVKETVKQFFAENFFYNPNGELGDEDSFLDLGLIDSTGVMELIAFLEETYDIVIEDDEIIPEYLDSLAGIDRYVAKKISIKV